MKKKQIFTLVMLVLFTISLGFAGSSRDSGDSSSEDKTTLQFWTWRPEDVDFYDGLITEFEKNNPEIEVVQTAHKNTEYNTILAASLQGGSGPDVFQTRAYGGLQTFTDSNFIEPLEDWVPELAGYSKAALGGATSITDNKVYGVPANGQTLFIYYNEAYYDELGLEVPQTWDEFISNLKIMKDAGIVPLANGTKDGWTVEVMLGAIAPVFYGANDFFDDVIAGETNFLDPQFKDSLEKLEELTNYMPNLYTGVGYTDMQANFINEIAGHFIGGSFEAGFFESQNPDLSFDVFPTPGEKASDTKYVSVYADMNFSMNAESKEKEAAAKFLQYLATREVGQKFVEDLKMVSFAPNVDTKASPFITKVLDLQKNSTPYIFLVGFRYNQPTGSSLFQAASQGYLAGTLSADDVCQQVQDGIATYYKPFQ